jgi:hypothetical protein
VGQYHYLVNCSKREYLNPHKLGEGFKLGQIANGWLSSLLVCLLSDGYQGPDCEHNLMGRWAASQIVIASDDPARGLLSLRTSYDSIHEACDEEPGWTEITPLVKEFVWELPVWLQKKVIDAEEL